MQPVQLKSTSLRAVAYHDQLALLELEFRSGAIYHYFDVSTSIYKALLRAESKGRYFNQYIRNSFTCAKIRAAIPQIAVS